MIDALLYRVKCLSDDQGTIGILSIPDLSWSCYTNELPDRDNQRSISRIPAGEYQVKIRQSHKYGAIFHLQDVKGRSYILIHAGNWAGDISKGYRTDSMGCILLGYKVALLHKQRAVTNSRTTLQTFMSKLDNKPFKLTIS